MADAPFTVPSGKNDPKSTVKWINAETSAMLNELAEHKATHMSGNGFKPQVWAKVVPKVIEANPDKSQQKDKSQCMNKLAYLKKISMLYVFVCKYSGSGWDNEQKHATNTSDYIEEFTKTNGKDYGRCFTTPCPYWTELDALFDNMTNQATGDNVLHLHTKTCRNRKSKDTGTITPSASTSTSRTPLQSLANVLNTPGSADPSNLDNADITLVDADVGAAPAAAGAFDDELGSVPESPVSKKHQRADMDDENDDGVSGGQQKVKRSRSESGGKARRNAEAGTQISRTLENFATVMVQPLVMSEDLSHVHIARAILSRRPPALAFSSSLIARTTSSNSATGPPAKKG